MPWNTTPRPILTANQLSVAENRVRTLRTALDGDLFHSHQDGTSIASLARTTGLSRQTIYTAIKRYKGHV